MSSGKNSFLTGLACRTNRTGQGVRKETEFFRRRLREFLVKNGY